MLTMFDNYYLEKGVALEPPILFGVQNSYRTRCPKYFAAIPRCRLSFTKRFFRCQAIHWWNALPSAFFHDITTFPATYLDTFLISLKLYNMVFMVAFVLRLYLFCFFVVCTYTELIVVVFVLFFVVCTYT